MCKYFFLSSASSSIYTNLCISSSMPTEFQPPMYSSASSSSSSSKRMLSLKSSDGDVFQIEESGIVSESKTIATLVKAGWPGQPPFPLPEASTETLSKVIQHCNKHRASGPSSNTDILHEWDAMFVDVGRYTPLLDLIMVIRFLHCYDDHIKSLS